MTIEGPARGASIADVFPPDDEAARFVVAMSMASNDISRAVDDLRRAGEVDGPDFTYRIRLLPGHLFEALVSLAAYQQRFEAIRLVLRQTPKERRADLSLVRGVIQKAGPKALARVRTNTFHYPSPDPAFNPTSDEELRVVLTAMTSQPAELHLDGDTQAVTATFADDAALDLATQGHVLTADEVRKRAALARDGAAAFLAWSRWLIGWYLTSQGRSIGRPVARPKPTPGPDAP